jgi:hypothetical protein
VNTLFYDLVKNRIPEMEYARESYGVCRIRRRSALFVSGRPPADLQTIVYTANPSASLRFLCAPAGPAGMNRSYDACTRSVFPGRVFPGSVFLGSVFLGSVFLGSVFLGSVHTDGDRLTAPRKLVPRFGEARSARSERGR